MKNSTVTSYLKEYSSLEEMTPMQIQLCKESLNIAATAYAPYSNFKVGAALLLSNGEIITANNQENAAYPSGLCAERVALFYANAKFPNQKVKIIAITAIQNGEQILDAISPCGACRQVIAETSIRFGNKIQIVLFAQKRIIEIDDAIDLLPFAFSKHELGN